jgi:FkbM family methyltransferase
MTRNGIKRHITDVDISAKDKNLFVYNASVTKGMVPLVERIWPEVKRQIPDAKLKVIGGYYRFRDNAEPDQQEKDWRRYLNNSEMKKQDIEFLGIIPQQEIAQILAKASFMIYPGAFPETFGISTLESLTYNTPLITTRFGALEETAIELASYMIDYAIVPNSLYPEINTDEQIKKFVQTVLFAYNTPYLHAQKIQYCNIVHDVSGWDTVALQWKQHFYRFLNQYLPINEYRKVSAINEKVHTIFKRRFSNPEEWQVTRQFEQDSIAVITPFYNAEAYIERCILSVASQDYERYVMHLIDDASTDSGYEVAKRTIATLPKDIQKKFHLHKNTTNVGAVCNQVTTIREQCQAPDIIMQLDGDDSLVNDPNIFHFYNNLYHEGAEFTYGSCWSMVDNIPLVAQPYPKHILDTRQYRNHKFAWGMPYTHLRTFRKILIDRVPDEAFKDENGDWYRAGGDTSIFYNVIEKTSPDTIRAVTKIVYNYNDMSPINDWKVNGVEQTKNATRVAGLAKPITHENADKDIVKTVERPLSAIAAMAVDLSPKTILIAIPTAKYIESDTFKSIYDLEIPDGYVTQLQHFYGYTIEQIRNLIADWGLHFDYLFCVDSDIVLPTDTLTKMLAADKDVISGVYIQRKEGVEIPELYQSNAHGGVSNISLAQIAKPDLYKIAACGFGGVLIKNKVLVKMGYPHFYYTSALDHKNTVSEDVFFCKKARENGFTIWVDSSIIFDHCGTKRFVPSIKDPEKRQALIKNTLDMKNRLDNGSWGSAEAKADFDMKSRFRTLGAERLLPKPAVDYLLSMKDLAFPVIYDIGACVMHWTNEAKQVWPNAEYVMFEAMDGPEFLYGEAGYRYHMGVLSDEDGKTVEFYENKTHPGGNSYYREQTPEVDQYFPESSKITKATRTLDSVVAEKKFPLPHLIKMDVQGAELDILKGAEKCLAHATDLILELQKEVYNVGAPLKNEVIAWLKENGWTCVAENFSQGGIDGDYHFIRVMGNFPNESLPASLE